LITIFVIVGVAWHVGKQDKFHFLIA
jgi:hypothetical protein